MEFFFVWGHFLGPSFLKFGTEVRGERSNGPLVSGAGSPSSLLKDGGLVPSRAFLRGNPDRSLLWCTSAPPPIVQTDTRGGVRLRKIQNKKRTCQGSSVFVKHCQFGHLWVVANAFGLPLWIF